MDAYDRCTNLGKKFTYSVAIYGRGRELFRPPTLLDRMTCNFTWMLMTDVPT